MLRLRPDQAEHRGTQQNAGNELTDHRRLADALHRLAEQAADEEQENDLGEEHHLGSAG